MSNKFHSNTSSPSRTSYRKYRCQSKTNALLHKLSNDSGYPQEIIDITRNNNANKNKNNYLIKNTKNLKNFFKDRLPKQTSKPIKFTNDIHFDQSKVLQMKKTMYDLKDQTRISLSNSFQIDKYPVKLDLSKIKQRFNLNDKNRQFKLSFLCDQTKQILQKFDIKQHFRLGTKCYKQKISNICKKKAYDSVFGPDISSMSQTMSTNLYRKKKTETEEKLQSKNQLRFQSYESVQMNKKRQEFSLLMDKMQGYKNQLNINSCEVNKWDKKVKNRKINENTQNDSKMITLIKNIAENYKSKSIEHNRTIINSVEDVEKINPEFYEKMKNHKINRLKRRMLNIEQSKILESTTFQNLENPNNQQNQSSLSLTIGYQTQKSQQDNNEYKMKPLTSFQKFQLFCRQLCAAVANAEIYGVKKEYFQQAFWKKYKPFQKEGSYAFFKTIKQGKLNSVKIFIQRQFEYLYQVDSKYRTTLNYACAHNQTEVIRYIIQCGINIDKKCIQDKTALFHALSYANIQIVKLLLQKGASPWSNPNCPYQAILKKHNLELLNRLFRNAKKIFLAVRLQPSNKVKTKFWLQNKYRINEQEDIIF